MTSEELVKLDPKDYQVEGGFTVKEVYGPKIEQVKRPCACGKPMRSGRKTCDDCWHERRVKERAEKRQKSKERAILASTAKSIKIHQPNGHYAASQNAAGEG